MKPFVFVDVKTKEIIIVIKNVVKRIKIKNLDDAEDFLDEFYVRFKEINFVPQYKTINRKDFVDLINGLKESEMEDTSSQPTSQEQEIIERRPPPSGVSDGKTEEDLENSTLIRSNTDRKIAIEDLNMRFDEPYDYYDLSVYDQEKVKKSAQLNFFMKKGMIVKTTMDEIASISSKRIAEKEREKKERQEALIVERKEVLGDEDENLITSEEYRNAGSDAPAENPDVEVDGSEAAQLVFSTFSNPSAAIGDETKSVDDLLRKT